LEKHDHADSVAYYVTMKTPTIYFRRILWIIFTDKTKMSWRTGTEYSESRP